MARPKLTEEELQAKQQEKEKQVNDYKEELKKIIDDMDNKTILKFIDTLDGYQGLERADAVNLLFNKFINKDFEFKVKCIYE